MRAKSLLAIILFAAGCGQKAEQSPSIAPPASPAADAQASPGKGQANPPTAPAPDAKADELAKVLERCSLAS